MNGETKTADRGSGNLAETGSGPAAPAWHTLEAEAVVAGVESRLEGLGEAEARKRLGEFGPNQIAAAQGDGPLQLFISQLKSPLLYVLMGSGALALAMGKLTDGAVVLGVVILNAIIGFIQEYRAQNAIAALGQMVPDIATVRRDGRVQRLASAEVVPGDVVLLQSGDKVPADLRLLSVKNLHVDEAALTGESIPVAKRIAAVAADSALGDRKCMSYGGTMVTHGTGVGVTVATGLLTEIGKISSLLKQTQEIATPLTRSMERVSLWLTWVILAVTFILLGVGLLRGYPLADAVVAGISLAVAAIPEGLPAIITIALAIGVRRMARRRVIIRSLPAVETLGSTTVICSDKTGTLTKNEMTVQAIWTRRGVFELSGVGYQPEGRLSMAGEELSVYPEGVMEVVRAGILCNDSHLAQDDKGIYHAEGDPTEVALVVSGRKLSLDEDLLAQQWRRLDVVPFESEKQIMGTLHLSPEGERVIFVKGAPEVVLRGCLSMGDGSAIDLEELRAAAERLAATGMRVLAMATRRLSETLEQLHEEDLGHDLVFLGLQGMSDPPRPEAILAVRDCRTAGIGVKMITGDHAGTARAVAEQLDLQQKGEVVTGNQLAAMSDDELRGVALSSNVFARVAPEHKLRLVSALQEEGNVVAMTGDGVNDAPALKRADIGVAMGITGTAVSRQASDMVLTDDNFASIVAAVEEGRRVYDNLVKSLAFVLPTNIGEALIVMVAVMFFPLTDGRPLMPVLPVQILWVNLVATVALALPLAFEAMEPGVMKRPPRDPQAPILDTFLNVRTLYVAVLMTAGAIILFFFELDLRTGQGVDRAQALSEAQTMAVTSIIAFQIFYLLSCRSIKRTVFAIGLFSNPTVFVGIATIIVLQLGFVYLPFLNQLFTSSPLGPAGWFRAFVVGATVWPVVAVEKAIRRKREEARTGPHR